VNNELERMGKEVAMA